MTTAEHWLEYQPQSSNVLIAINGGPGFSSRYMLDLEQFAGPQFAVVTYDQRGAGRSTAPPLEPSHYGLAKYEEDLEAVRQKVGAEQVHLLVVWAAMPPTQPLVTYPVDGLPQTANVPLEAGATILATSFAVA